MKNTNSELLLNCCDSIDSHFINQIKDYAIFTTDDHGIISRWNLGAVRLKGFEDSEVIGQFYGLLFPEDYRKAGKPETEMAEALLNGSYEAEDWRMRKDGSLFWAYVLLTPIYSESGQHIGFTKITGDRTREKNLKDKLAARNQHSMEHKNSELMKVNLDLDNFIYMASHDLKSPITNIEGLMSHLQEELERCENTSVHTNDILQRVDKSIQRFKKTIGDITEISKLQKDVAGNPSSEVLNIKEICEDIIADLGYFDNCLVQTDYNVHLVRFSRKNFRSVLYNLISNVHKFQAKSRPCILSIHTEIADPYVIITIKDNGSGMHKSQLDQLFTKFKRFHPDVEGTGIGLYMVKKIMDNSLGKIEVESTEGEGTTFKVYFLSDL